MGTHCDCWTWLLMSGTYLTSRKSSSFIFQEVQRYQRAKDELGPDVRDDRPHRQYGKPTVEKINGRQYFIATDVFDLSAGGRKLDEQELRGLPFNPCYNGKVHFKSDRREAFELLMRLFGNGNLLMDSEFYSFMLGRFIVC